MREQLKKRSAAGDDIVAWIGLALVLAAAIILDKGSAPHKWHAAIMWTFVTFLCLLRFGRKKWNSWLFWAFWATCFGLHLFAMWLIFERLLPRLILGTLYVVPVAFIEGIFLVGMFARLEHKPALERATPPTIPRL